jgi:hypothetical protein
MERHVELIAILWIILGILGIMFGFVIFLVLLGVSFIINTGDLAPGILRIGAWFVSVFFMAFSLPELIGGIGLLKKKEWGRILVLVVSFFNLIHFPLGTALSIYSLVILLKEETAKLFRPSS